MSPSFAQKKYPMKNVLTFCAAMTLFSCFTYAQHSTVRLPRIEPCDCQVKIDSNFKTQCGYLIVPENRRKKSSNTIKLPFIIVKSNNPNKRKDPILYTAGGPGGSSLRWTSSLSNRVLVENRDCIAFEQRGTHFALPSLWSGELVEAIQESYRKNLPKDSMVIEGTKRYKKALEARGIDLEGYNTDETVSDIHDLLTTLKIDSVNLFGGSYSGGLMLAVLQKAPARIRSLVLDSPLPTYVPIDEEEPANFNEALKIMFERCERDSSDKVLYRNLFEKFQTYFTSIGGKTFTIPHYDKVTKDTLQIQYTRNDLLYSIVNTMYSYRSLKKVPFMITEIIADRHQPYVTETLNSVLQGSAPSGMRISVYCADQMAYHDEAVLQQSYELYPQVAGFRINDVFQEMCSCWNVPPIQAQTKQPFYSSKPALLAAGAMDPACRPLYIDLIQHYLPNSQRVLYLTRSHMVLGGKDGDRMIREFLDQPYKRVEIREKDVIGY
jgi:pimeloyl-ACP methyl ester carboxylesterase